MREELCGLLDEGRGPGVLAKQRESGGTAAEIPDYVHELRDDLHDRLSRLQRGPLPEHDYSSPARSSSRRLSMRLRRPLRAGLSRVGANGDAAIGDRRQRQLDTITATDDLDEEHFFAARVGPTKSPTNQRRSAAGERIPGRCDPPLPLPVAIEALLEGDVSHPDVAEASELGLAARCD
jgi:hypothetical protein